MLATKMAASTGVSAGRNGRSAALIARSPASSPLPLRERVTSSASETSGEGCRRVSGLRSRLPSSRDLPGRSFFGILDHDPHRRKLIADTIGFLEVLAGPRGGAVRNQFFDMARINPRLLMSKDVLKPYSSQTKT